MSDMWNQPGASPNLEAETLLSPRKAAHHLGITPELLFFYTSRSFQKRPGDNRRLGTREVAGATCFERGELDAFDSYLREPWAEASEKRREVPQKVLAYLHAESGGACIRCGSGVGVETAHIDPWATSRCNHHHNLLRICSHCHNEHDLHHSLPVEELRKLKAAGIERLRAQLQNRMTGATPIRAPAPDVQFFGREGELTELRDALRTEQFILLRGPGGIGKTELTLQALLRAETGRPVLWIEVERYGTVDAVHAALDVTLREQAGVPPTGELTNRLDALQACLVLDGVEHLRGPNLDALDDWISVLQARLSTAQVLVTSQVDLQRTRFDRLVSLDGIDEQSSQRLLEQFVRPGTPLDRISNAALVAFADGHPLTLRIVAALVNYFGSGRAAHTQIQRHGAELLEWPKRATLDRRTSLTICLSLAYDELNAEEQILLLLVANAPGGLVTALISTRKTGLTNVPAAIAGARRWSLVGITNAGERSERIHMLSPIAAYVVSRWQRDAPDKARTYTKNLAFDFTAMAAVIDQRSEEPTEIPYMVARYDQEIPNLLRVLDFAECEPNDTELNAFAGAICAALMRYFFVLGLGEAGANVMLRGARIALRGGQLKQASGLLSRLFALAARSADRTSITSAMAILEEIERDAVDAETRGNVALSRAMCAHLSSDTSTMEHHARSAISFFEKARTEKVQRTLDISDDTIDLDDIDNDLSASFGLLGDALLARGLYSDGAVAYRAALSYLRGASVAVNDGQLQHQIGNCESNLGNHGEAARCYIAAAMRFHAIGMRDYLSNALGELGHAVLAADFGTDVPTMPDYGVIGDGLVDLAGHLSDSYAAAPIDLNDCATAVRKLFGLIVLASLSEHAEGLGAFSAELKENLLDPALAACNLDNPESRRFANYHLELLLALAESIATFQFRVERYGMSEAEVEQLARVCHHQGPWGDLRGLSFRWLALYLRHKWALHVGTGDELRAAADSAATSGSFTISRMSS